MTVNNLPKLSQAIEQIENQCIDWVPKTVADNVNEKEQEYEKIKKEYFRDRLVKDILRDWTKDNETCQEAKQISEIVDLEDAIIALKENNIDDPATGLTLSELNATRNNLYKKNAGWIDDFISRRLEEGLGSLSKKLVAFMNIEKSESFDSTVNVIKTMSAEMDTLLSDNIKAKREISEISRKFYDLSSELVAKIEKTKNEFAETHVANRNSVFDEYFETVTENIQLKLRILHMENLIITYDQETCLKLKEKKEFYSKEVEKTARAISNAEKKLKQYNFLGSEFEKIVSQYAQISQKINLLSQDLAQME